MRLREVGVVKGLLEGGLSWDTETELRLVLPWMGWTKCGVSWRSLLLVGAESCTWMTGEDFLAASIVKVRA